MFVLNGALFGIWAARIPAIAERHALSHATLGLMLLLLAGGAILSFPLAGRLSDKLGAARVTMMIAMAYAAALILIAAAPSLGLLACAILIFGATHGAMDVTMNAWAAEVERHLARPVMSSFHAMFSLGAGVGAGTGYLAASGNVEIAVHFPIACLGFAALTLPLANIGWQSDTQKDVAGPVFAIPKGPLFFVGLLAFCAALGEGAMADWGAIFLIQTTRASEATAALGYTVFSIAMVIMRLIGDHAIRTFGPVATCRYAGATAAAGALLMTAIGGYVAALCGFVLLGIGYAVIMPLAFSRAANDPNTSPGAALASVSTLGYGGLLLGPPVIGFLSSWTSIKAAFGVLTALAFLIILLSGALTKPAKAR